MTDQENSPTVGDFDILPAQCRMARAGLGLKIAELAALANVSTNTVVRFERGEELKSATVRGLKNALESAGISFIPENGGGVGVRFDKPTSRKTTV